MTPMEINLEEKQEYVPIPMIQDPIFPVHTDVAPQVQRTIDTTPVESPATTSSIAPNDEPNEHVQQPPVVMNEQNNEQPLRRSQRERRSAIPSDYVTYMSEDMNELMLDDDPTSFKEAMNNEHSSK